jgi:hypothetical protein
VLLLSFFLEVILFQLCFVLLHYEWRLRLFIIRHYRFLGFVFLLVLHQQSHFFTILSSNIIGYCLCCSGEPITLISSSILVNAVTELCKVSLQTVLIVVVAPIGTSLVESVGSLVSCRLPGSLTSGLFLVAVVSHGFLRCKWLYRRLALHAFYLIMLNENKLFNLITVAL